MSSENRFGMLRKLLRALGLSQQAADDVVDFIVELLAGENKSKHDESAPQFPYRLQKNFLSPAELNFYGVLRTAIDQKLTICIKVGLRDIFYAQTNDPSRHRIYTNKIDRKHVDFLLCDTATMEPIVGIELDDKSHQRKDRQERDAFVDGVFEAAGLPLLHVPARRAYRLSDIHAYIAPYLDNSRGASEPMMRESTSHEAPECPKCGNIMVLRTAKKGVNAGNQFWGCPQYPRCKTIIQID